MENRRDPGRGRMPWVFTDVDWTLIPPRREISKRNADAISAYTRAGGRVSLASGRHHLALRSLVSALGLECPQIAGNGSVVFDSRGERLLAGIADRGPEAEGRLRASRIPHVLYTVRGLFLQSSDVTDDHLALLVAVFHDYRPARSAPTDPEKLFKILTFIDSTDLERDRAVREIGAASGLKAERTGPSFLELISPEAGKGRAIQRILAEDHWPAEQAAAVGDSQNDISMLRVVGIPAAVGNAGPEVKRAATRLLPPCDEDGFAVLLEEFLATCQVSQP